MKKALSVVALALVLVLSLAFIGCGGKINQKAADKINEAAESGKPMTMAELKDKYGDPYIDATTDGGFAGIIDAGDGYAVWIDCAADEVDAKKENKEKVAAITVTFDNFSATAAEFTDDYFKVAE
ncbi:MAG: hypothetical protein E7382_04275 [Clostridiales bacterium]|nr:hypothetical protein [Clostridiales bacterium]